LICAIASTSGLDEEIEGRIFSLSVAAQMLLNPVAGHLQLTLFARHSFALPRGTQRGLS
jgi:hypothetical protein